MTIYPRYSVPVVLSASAVVLTAHFFFQPHESAPAKSETICAGMTSIEIVEILGEPITDREYQGKRIMTFKGEGATCVVYLDLSDDIVTDATWAPNRPCWTDSELIWNWLFAAN